MENQNLNNEESVTPLSKVHEFHQIMEQNNLIMIYEGEFSQEITKSVLAMTEKNFDAEGIDAVLKKKVFNVMMEALQNICKHQQPSATQTTSILPIFMIGLKEGEYSIISGNLIQNDKIEIVKSKLDKINSLDKEGLKEYYKQARLESTISNVGGAGLGFIDMARKSGNKLGYLFKTINDTVSFFYMEIKIANTKE